MIALMQNCFCERTPTANIHLIKQLISHQLSLANANAKEKILRRNHDLKIQKNSK